MALDNEKKKSFITRFISGTVILILTIVLGALGGPVLATALCIIACKGYLEFTKATKVLDEGRIINVLQIVGLGTIILYYVALLLQDDLYCPEPVRAWLTKTVGTFNMFTILILLIFITGFIGILYVYIFMYPRFKFQQVSNSVFGMLYVGLTLSFIYYIRELPGGIYLVWMPFISAWFSDTCAYFVGVLIGKHKMTPRLSPKKTYEGAAGGVLGATVGSAILGLVFTLANHTGAVSILSFACMGLVGSVASMCGDLSASAIKRNNDVKDFGKIIPGHGGVLDRFDSVIFTAPMVYFLMILLLQLAEVE